MSVESTFSSTDLWQAFETQLQGLGGRLITQDELTQMLKKSCFVEEAAATVLGVPQSSKDIWEVEVGISVADLAIAEMGSLVVSAGPGRHRMSSLVPPVNIMLIRHDAIVAKLADAISKIPSRSSAIVTGPSRTADIEGILVKGVHGPGELLVYVYD